MSSITPWGYSTFTQVTDLNLSKFLMLMGNLLSSVIPCDMKPEILETFFVKPFHEWLKKNEERRENLLDSWKLFKNLFPLARSDEKSSRREIFEEIMKGIEEPMRISTRDIENAFDRYVDQMCQVAEILIPEQFFDKETFKTALCKILNGRVTRSVKMDVKELPNPACLLLLQEKLSEKKSNLTDWIHVHRTNPVLDQKGTSLEKIIDESFKN